MATATTNHDEIRQWVEARGGHPAHVKTTGSRKDPGILRIDFPGFSGEDTLEEIGWDEFFTWFDENGLAMLISDEKGNRFNKLVSRANASPAKKKSSSLRAVESSSGKTTGAKKAPAKKAGSSKKSSSLRAVESSSGRTAAKAGPAKKAGSAKKSSSLRAVKSSSGKTAAKKAAPAEKSSSLRAVKSSSRKTAAKKAGPAKKAAPAKKKAFSTKKTAAKAPRRLVASKTRRPSPAKKATPAKKTATAKKTASAKKRTATKKAAVSKTTTSHAEIQKWVEARGGFPAHVKRTGRKRGDLGVLRIDYPGFSGNETLERIEWDDWFDAFDRNELAFLYQDKRNSRFSKLVNR